MTVRGLRLLSILSVVLVAVGFGLVFFYAPLDTDQGFRQKIFYLHVPLGIVGLCGFIVAAWHGFRYLRTGDPASDLRAYVYIHMSQIVAVAVLITGGIWGKTAWGTWWRWDEPFLVSFLFLFLIYATYQVLRFSIDDPQRQARAASAFAIAAGAFVPVNFTVVRMANQYLHPRTLDNAANGGLPGPVLVTFLICFLAIATLFVTLVRYELLSKSTTFRLRSLERRAGGDDLLPRRSAVLQA
ncbi:MAG: cytochrome c biogenesis protein CcsA [Patulibacter minatonensis]